LFFFFSSRRRHTRFSRDWSSDVCSSDLGENLLYLVIVLASLLNIQLATGEIEETIHLGIGIIIFVPRAAAMEKWIELLVDGWARSEERRVGKECRCRWSPDDERKES